MELTLTNKISTDLPLFIGPVQAGRTHTINFLKEKADMNKQDQDGMTPLHRAVEGNHLSAVRLLLQTSSVDYLIQDHKGRTPYRLAVDLRLTPIIQLFEQSIPEPQTRET